MKQLILFIMLTSIALSSVTMIYPKELTVNYGHYDENQDYFLGVHELGKVAPGQQISLVFSRNTGDNNTESPASIYWESATGKNVISKLSGNTIEAVFTAPEKLGTYLFNITLKGNEIGTIAPHIISFRIETSEDAYEYTFDRMHTMKAGESKEFIIVVKSNSVADDTILFEKAEGIPSGWIVINNIELKSGETKTTTATLTPNEEGHYSANLLIGKKSTAHLDEEEITVWAKPTFTSKMKSFNEGFSIIPVIMQPFYSIFSMIGSF